MYEPLQLTQAFRNFADGASPWEQVGAGTESTPEVSRRVDEDELQARACAHARVDTGVRLVNSCANVPTGLQDPPAPAPRRGEEVVDRDVTSKSCAA